MTASARLRLTAACLAVLVAGWANAAAKGAADAVPWGKLTPVQQAFLAPLKADWSQLEIAQQLKWQEVAARAPSMGEGERERVRQRMTEWARMTPLQRTQARLQFQEVRQLPQDERQARWQAYQALSDAERQQLTQRAQPSASSRASGPVQPVVVRPGGSAASAPVAVTPILVQARPGATTSAMRPQAGVRTAQASGPKIAASAKDVDPATLLPKPAAANQAPSPVVAPPAASSAADSAAPHP